MGFILREKQPKMKKEDIINIKHLLNKFGRKLKEFENSNEKKKKTLKDELAELQKQINIRIK